MSNQPWRDRLKQSLYRQGLSREYISRLVEELSDHATDLFMEDERMDALKEIDDRLGSPERIALVAMNEFRRRTFFGRHPALTFIAGPMIAMIGLCIATYLICAVPIWMIEQTFGENYFPSEELGVPLGSPEVGPRVRGLVLALGGKDATRTGACRCGTAPRRAARPQCLCRLSRAPTHLGLVDATKALRALGLEDQRDAPGDRVGVPTAVVHVGIAGDNPDHVRHRQRPVPRLVRPRTHRLDGQALARATVWM